MGQRAAGRRLLGLAVRGALVAVTALSLQVGAAVAAPPPRAVTQFNIIGFIQVAAFDGPDILAGGTLIVNNHRIVVPRNTIVEMPATALTWGELFTLAPAPYGPTQTGMALADVPSPLTTYEVNVVGNRVDDVYIAGLITLSQQALNTGQGYVSFIDYVRGELRVGGVIGDPSTGTRVRLNDPAGRFSRAASPDARFTIDEDNPTVRSRTGFPMCVPRTDPALGSDPLCPQTNRPRDLTSPTGFAQIFTMGNPDLGLPPDATLQAPFEVGDFVTYAGTLVKDGPQPSAGPPTPFDSTYVSAWAAVADVGISTWPGADPAYIALDVTILGVGGVTVAGAVEATTRTRFEGFTTDPTRLVELYGIDVDPCTGETKDRAWGTVDVDQGPPVGAVRGRWRFRPPTTVLSLPPSGSFLPATREVRARISRSAQIVVANGLIAGQYHAPIAEYLFPENAAVGAPIVPNNFESMPFLAKGIGPWQGGGPNPIPAGIVGQLSPWPGRPAPIPSACAPAVLQPPIADAGHDLSVPSGATVTLDGSASRDLNGQSLVFAWTQTAGPTVVLSSPSVARPTFLAPTLALGDPTVALAFTLIVSDGAGPSAPATVTVTVSPPSATLPPVASAGPSQTIPSGIGMVLDGTGSFDANTPPLALAYQWTQIAPVAPVFDLAGANTVTPIFAVPVVAPGGALVVTFQLTVTNSAGLSATATVDLTVSPVAAPLARTGPDQSVLTGAPVQLDGTGSIDAVGLPLTFAWAQVSGPPVTLVGADTATPTFTAPILTPGTSPTPLVFLLTVSDGLLTSVAAQTTVTVFANADVVQIVSAVYRIGKQRLTVTATSSYPSAKLFLKDPAGGPDIQMFPGVGGLVVDLVGVPPPLSATVVSSVGGSATSAITRLR